MTPLVKKHAKSARPGNGRKMLPGFAGALFFMTLAFASGVADANCPIKSGNVERTRDLDFTNGASIVTHTSKTGLIWKECVEGLSGDNTCATGTAATYTWQDALKRAVTAGAGWRLPSRNELLSLVETGCSTNMINTTLFPNSPVSRTFWTSTPAGEGNPTAAWTVRFGDGTVRAANKNNLYYVRLVSGPSTDTNSETYDQQLALPATGPSNAFPLFTAATNQAPGDLVTSNTVTLTGVTGTVPISIIGGEYAVSSTVTFTNGTDLVNWTGHGLAAGRTLRFSNAGGALPTGIVATTDYYVISSGLTANAFKIATAPEGTAVNFTTDGTGTNTAWPWTSATGVIGNQSLTVRMVASPNVSTTKLATVTINGRTTSFSVTTAATVTSEPMPVSIPIKTNVTRGARIVMDPVQITGLTASRTASVTAVTAGGTPYFNVGATSAPTAQLDATNKAITNTQWLTTSIIAPTAINTSASAVATIFGYDIPFQVTTAIEPTPFSFTSNTNVTPGAVTTSNTVALAGLTLQAGTNNPYSISGGTTPQFCLNGCTGGTLWTATGSNNLSNTNTFAVRHTAATCPNTTTTTNLVINGYNFPFSSTTAAGQQPSSFSYAAVSPTFKGVYVNSASSGVLDCLTGPVGISIDANGEYSINNTSSFTSTAGTVNPGDLVYVRVLTPLTDSTAKSTQLTINGYQFPAFTATTGTGPSNASNAFGSKTTTGTTAVNSVSVTIVGLSPATGAPISIDYAPGTTLGTPQFTTNGGTNWYNIGDTTRTVNNNGAVMMRITPGTGSRTARLTINGQTFDYTLTK